MSGFEQSPDFNRQHNGLAQGDDHPVVDVSWNDATTFCYWLSNKEKRKYRLPTEAEYEYACTAGTTTRYHSGDLPTSLLQVANVGDLAFGEKFYLTLDEEALKKVAAGGVVLDGNDGFAFTSPVCRFQPNAFGLYDMHGNAATWCSDCYSKDYYSVSPTDDPSGPDINGHRIIRGGGFGTPPWRCRSSRRSHYNASYRDFDLGFRVVFEHSSPE